MVLLFGEFELDVDARQLRRRGEPVVMQPKVFETLRYLVENRDHVVTKQELLDALWEGRSVNRIAVPWSISHARRALGQRGEEGLMIETVRGRGYRFAADVQQPAPGSSEPPPEAGAGPSQRPPRTTSVRPGEPFVGREAVMEALTAALQDARDGAGRLVVLTGEAGIGKTRCATELASLARRTGIDAWVGRCVVGGGTPALWPWIQILRQAVADRRTGTPERKAAEAMLARLEPAGSSTEVPAPSEAARFWLTEALVRCLRLAAEGRPRLLVVDDLHAADEASLDVLALLAPDLSTTRMLVVATAREGALSPTASESMLARRLRPADVIGLSGLTLADVDAFIAGAMGRDAPAELTRAVHERTAGNPLFLREAVRLLASRAARGGVLRAEDVRLPEVARELLRERLATLDARTRVVLDVASTIGEEFELPVLQRVAAFPAQELLACLDRAAQARFVEARPQSLAYAFTHALIRDALYDALPAARRVRLHEQIAESLESLAVADPPLAAIAHHLHAALSEHTAQDVTRYSRLAGDAAMRVFAFDEAAQLYSWALAGQGFAPHPDPRASCELLLASANALRWSGRVSEARAQCSKAVEIAKRERFAGPLVNAARSMRPTVWLATVPDRMVLGALERALELLPDEARAARAQALGLLAGVPPYALDIQTSRTMSQQALAIARELGDRSLLLEALVSTFHSLSGPDSIDALLAAADEVLRLDGPPLTWWSGEAFFARYNALLQRGDAAAADRALEAFGQCAKRLRISEAVWQHDRVKAQRAMYAGDFAGAEASFHDLYSRSARFRIYGAFQYAAQMNALSWVRTGRPLAAALQGTQEVAWKWAASIATFRAEKVLILLDAGDRDAARAEFRDVSRDNFRAVSRDLSYLYALCRLALAAVALEAKDEAVTLAALLRPYAKFFGINGLAISVGSVAHFLGLLARFLGDSAGAARHLEEAVEMNGRLGHTVHALQSKAALAAVLREHGTEGGAARAEALVAEVRAEADRLGMTSV